MEEFQKPNNMQVELVFGCQMNCDFCGQYSVRKNGVGRVINFMKFELARLIANEIGKWFKKGKRIEFAMHGEPTLHPELLSILDMFRFHHPLGQLQVTTNGVTLLQNKVDIKDIMRETNILIIDTYTNREELIDIANSSGYPVYDYYEDPKGPNPYHYHSAKFKGIFLFDDLGKVNKKRLARIILNHAGNSNVQLLKDKYGIPIITDWLQKKCSRPFRELTINWDGTVSVCCLDFRHEFIVGKFGKRSLEDIWNDLIFNIARNLLYNKYRGFLPCYRCDYKGGFYLGFLKPVSLNFTQPQMLDILSSYHNQMKKYEHKNAVDILFQEKKNLISKWRTK